VLDQDWIQGGFELWIARLERGARWPVHLALLGGSGANIAMQVAL
jgi:hypothetical protein